MGHMIRCISLPSFGNWDEHVLRGYFVVPFPVGNPIKEVNLLDPKDPPGPVGPNPPKWPLLLNVSNFLLLLVGSFFGLKGVSLGLLAKSTCAVPLEVDAPLVSFLK